MKKSNKLAAAGVGLLIAAAASMVPAMASDGTEGLNIDNSTLEVTGVSEGSAEETVSTEENADAVEVAEEVSAEETSEPKSNELQVGGVDEDSSAADEVEETKPEEDAASSTKQDTNTAAEVETSEEESTEDEAVASVEVEQSKPVVEKAAEKTEDVEETTTDSTDSVDVANTEKTEKTEKTEVKKPGAVPVPVVEEETEATVAPEVEASPKPVVTTPEVEEVDSTEAQQTEAPAASVDVSPATTAPVVEKTQESKPSRPARSQSKSESSVSAAAPKKAPVPVKIVKVNYVAAPTTLSTSRSVNTVGKVKTAPKPQELGPVLPLLDAVSEAPVTAGTVNLQPEAMGAETENGQSMVVWFELPPAQGPALQPGESTTPLLGSAVTETAVNSNVIPASQVAPQKAPAGVTATASAAVPVASATVAEHGVMARTLARTGSLAQYAAMLSAVAMIIGVGMLIGAAAARRKQDY